LIPCAAAAQAPGSATPPSLEVDQNVINLPTTMSLKRHQSYFRLTHRFTRDLRRGDFGSLAADLFSLDNGAIIGLEYRFGITSALHAGVHRSMLSRTIEFFGKYDAWKQEGGHPVSVSILAAVEGLDNFQDNYQPGIAGTLSRIISDGRIALYATPTIVWNTRAAEFLEGHEDHDHDIIPGGGVGEDTQHGHTAMLGVGGRFRIRPTFYVSGEVTPRIAGHDPGRATWAIAAEKKTGSGGHTLSLALTNSFGTTLGQIARGGSDHDIYLGFNITRRF
jgi:hypothetical protein